MGTKEQWFTLLVVLAAALIGLCVLAEAARAARVASDPSPPGLIVADYDQALAWGGKILGFATTLAGFFGIAAGAGNALRGVEPTGAGAGLAGVLAGATMLELGGWAAPAALGALVLGGSAVRVAQIRRADAG